MPRLPLAALLALAPLLAGCGDDGAATAPLADHVGTYRMESLNGTALPVVQGPIDGVTYTLLEGRITLSGNGAASDLYSWRMEEGDSSVEETETDSGSYTRSGGSTIRVQWASGFSETFHLSGSTLTLSEPGYVAVYRK